MGDCPKKKITKLDVGVAQVASYLDTLETLRAEKQALAEALALSQQTCEALTAQLGKAQADAERLAR